MPRDPAGNYTLPAGNPVITGTVITSTWANPTMSDIGAEIGNSLSRDGQGGMRAPLEFADGTTNDPSITFVTEPTLGIYRAANQTLGIVGVGIDIALFNGLTGDVTVANQTKALAVEPVDANDLTRKDYVDALIAAVLEKVDKPIGALEFGYDPNGVMAGTWTQLPEGTFIMNTIGGVDAAGGDNDAAVIEHDHDIDHDHPSTSTSTNGNHTHTIDRGNTTGNSNLADEGDNNNGTLKSSTNGAHTHSLNLPAYVGKSSTDGEAAAGRNRPLYKGVEVWERTA